MSSFIWKGPEWVKVYISVQHPKTVAGGLISVLAFQNQERDQLIATRPGLANEKKQQKKQPGKPVAGGERNANSANGSTDLELGTKAFLHETPRACKSDAINVCLKT